MDETPCPTRSLLLRRGPYPLNIRKEGGKIWIRKFIASLSKPINHPLTTLSFHTLLDLDKVFEPVVPPNISKGC